MGEPFHTGEIEIQRRAGLREAAGRVGKILAPDLPERFRPVLARQRLAIAASVGAEGRVQATLLTGPEGFLAPVDHELLEISVPLESVAPVLRDLEVRPELGLLVFDPTRRQRLRINGRGHASPEGLFVLVDRAYGNCSKYIHLREPLPDERTIAAAPACVGRSLSERQRLRIDSADTFFIASFHPSGGADASHRGGLPGFVRVLEPDRLSFADFPGNAMFNTLGNILEHPHVGLLFLDFASGGVLQLTGEASVTPDFVVEVAIDEVREIPVATSLRYRLLENSPAIPDSVRSAGGISRGQQTIHERRTQR
jgi:predicted pyridoxine 5'-phosphate oxidase superfamily flavin-nucleotide-binding protein